MSSGTLCKRQEYGRGRNGDRTDFSVLDLVRRRFEVDNGLFRGSVEITTYELDEILATKLRAYTSAKRVAIYSISGLLLEVPL